MKIITAQELTSFTFKQLYETTESDTSTILIEMVHHHLQSVTYRVAFPWLVSSLAGWYTISVTNAGQRSAQADVLIAMVDCELRIDF